MTLSTTAVAFTVTFVDKFRLTAAEAPLRVPSMLFWSWIAYVAAIVFAIWTTMAIVGTMTAVGKGATIEKHANIKVPGGFMIAAFVLAVALTIAAGRQAMTGAH